VRWVIVGPGLEARCWARERGIALGSVIVLERGGDAARLRGLAGDGVAIVELARVPDPDGELAARLTALDVLGARLVPATWRPGPDTDLRLQLRPEGAGGAA
jgi:hypothetical protein